MSMVNRTALLNGRVLIDSELVENRCVLVEADRIVAVVEPADPRCASAHKHDLGGKLLLPGFIDLQVNGGGGVLFNDAPGVESIRAIGAAHRRFGTTGFLPTLISADLDVVAEAIAAVQAALKPFGEGDIKYSEQTIAGGHSDTQAAEAGAEGKIPDY